MVRKTINDQGNFNEVIGEITLDDEKYEQYCRLFKEDMISIEPVYTIDKNGNMEIHSFSLVLKPQTK